MAEKMTFEKFTSGFGGLTLVDELADALETVEGIHIYTQKREMEIKVNCSRLLCWDEIRFIEQQLASRLSLNQASLKILV